MQLPCKIFHQVKSVRLIALFIYNMYITYITLYVITLHYSRTVIQHKQTWHQDKFVTWPEFSWSYVLMLNARLEIEVKDVSFAVTESFIKSKSDCWNNSPLKMVFMFLSLTDNFKISCELDELESCWENTCVSLIYSTFCKLTLFFFTESHKEAQRDK